MGENVPVCAPPPASPAQRVPDDLDIAEVTSRMAQGDEWGWRMFHDHYFDRLWRYLLVCAAGDEDLARESLQAASVRVARHVRVFQDTGALWSWLTVLARSALADERKKRRRYFSFLERFRREREIKSAEDETADDRLMALLDRQMDLLTEDERCLLEEKYFERRSVREIAEERHASEKAVESHLSRIRRKLKDGALQDLKHESER